MSVIKAVVADCNQHLMRGYHSWSGASRGYTLEELAMGVFPLIYLKVLLGDQNSGEECVCEAAGLPSCPACSLEYVPSAVTEQLRRNKRKLIFAPHTLQNAASFNIKRDPKRNILRYLLSYFSFLHSVDPATTMEERERIFDLLRVAEGGSSLLITMVERDDLAAVEALMDPRYVETGFFSNPATTHDEHGQNALHIAAYRGNVSMVKLFLETNDVNELTNDSKTALELAALYGHFPVVKLLAERKGVSRLSIRAAVARARERKHSDIEQYLLQHGGEEEPT